MKIWLYKNNLDGHPDYEDPASLFSRSTPCDWGGTGDTINTPRATRWVEEDMAPGDLVFMQRRSRGKTMIVGIARVTDLPRRYGGVEIWLEPVEQFINGDLARMRNERPSDHARIEAFRPGPLDAIQPVSPAEARLILRFVGSKQKV